VRKGRVDRGDVDIDLPVADQLAVEGQDVGVGHRHRLPVLAAVFDVDLDDGRVAELPHIPDVVGETGDGLPHRVPSRDRIRVAESEHHVGREMGDERVRVESVDVGENRCYVSAHGVLLSEMDWW